MKYKLKTLSPIHIGSGDIYSAQNVYCYNDQVLIVDEDIIIKKLLEQGLSYKIIIEKIDLLVTEEEENLINILKKGSFSFDDLKIKHKLKNKDGLYKIKEIKENTKSFKGLCIYGSSIKGAIRTAVLHKYIKEKGISFIKDIIRFVENFILTKNRNYKNMTVDDYILYLHGKNLYPDRKLNYNIISPQKDPFKFLIVRDADFKADIDGCVYREKIINTSKPGNTIEAIPENYVSNEFEIKITNEENVFKIAELSKVNKDILEYLDDSKLRECIYEHSKDIIENEIEYFNKLSLDAFNKVKTINDLENLKKISSLEAPVIRLGKNTGLFSHSIALTVKTIDPDFYRSNFVKFLKKCNKGFKMYDNFEFPKTRKFVGKAFSPKLLGFTLLKKVD